MKKLTSIEKLELPQRIINSLFHYAKISTLEELMKLSDAQLLKIRGIGITSIQYIHEYLDQLHIDEE